MVKAYEQPNSVGMTADESEAQYQAFMKHSTYPLTPYKTQGDATGTQPRTARYDEPPPVSSDVGRRPH